MKKINVLVVDDHPVYRVGLKQLFSETKDIQVAGEAGNGQSGMQLALRDHHHVVLLDIGLPDMSGIEFLKEIKRKKPETAVLIMSVYAEHLYGVRAMKDGADGYITKDADTEQIIQAVRNVYNGEKYITPVLAEALSEYVQEKETKRPHELLSDREFQILLMLADGSAVKEIAKKLSISAKTVSTYHTRILQKMNMKSNAELVRYVVENGLQEL